MCIKKEEKFMLCQDCGSVRPFDLKGHNEEYYCGCGGQWCGCKTCNEKVKKAIADQYKK